jgi:hypothetical protein
VTPAPDAGTSDTAPAARHRKVGAPKTVAAAPTPAPPAAAPDEFIVRELATPARSLAAGNILGEGTLVISGLERADEAAP